MTTKDITTHILQQIVNTIAKYTDHPDQFYITNDYRTQHYIRLLSLITRKPTLTISVHGPNINIKQPGNPDTKIPLANPNYLQEIITTCQQLLETKPTDSSQKQSTTTSKNTSQTAT